MLPVISVSINFDFGVQFFQFFCVKMEIARILGISVKDLVMSNLRHEPH